MTSACGGVEELGARRKTGGGSRCAHVCFVSMGIYPILTASKDIEFAGGGEVQQAILARALHAEGYRVSVLTADYGQAEVVDCDGVQIHRVADAGRRGVKGLRFIYPMITDVVAGLDRIDPDIVYFRVAGSRAAAAAWYALRRRKRFVYACASDREFQSRKVSRLPPRDEFLFRMALRAADGVLVQNIRQQQLFKTNFDRDAVIAPNCYLEPQAGCCAPGGSVLWVGVFKPVKRPDLFLELARQNPDRRFVMVGGADNRNDPDKIYYGRMRDMAVQLPNLRFVGHVPFSEVGRHFDEASLFVNTSDLEGFPNTFLQAWIRGLPTLSFVRPEVSAGETGTIACRDVADMAARVAQLSADAVAWRQASDACRSHFHKNHSVEVVLRQYREFFHSLDRSA
jgi:glycosyltransferase involved in cell wall biosynthesis